MLVCNKCGWKYKDNPKIMGIHRTPIYCPICGHKNSPKDKK